MYQSQPPPSSQFPASAVADYDIKAVLDQLTSQIDQLRCIVEEQERQSQTGNA
jgi:hypothetical protein